MKTAFFGRLERAPTINPPFADNSRLLYALNLFSMLEQGLFWNMGSIGENELSGALQPSQPPPGILYLRKTWVSVLPQVKEFFVIPYGFGCIALLFMDFAKHVEGFGIDVAEIEPACG